jgi:hypothetical protein
MNAKAVQQTATSASIIAHFVKKPLLRLNLRPCRLGGCPFVIVTVLLIVPPL